MSGRSPSCNDCPRWLDLEGAYKREVGQKSCLSNLHAAEYDKRRATERQLDETRCQMAAVSAQLDLLRAYLRQEYDRPNYAEIDGAPGPAEFAVDKLRSFTLGCDGCAR